MRSKELARTSPHMIVSLVETTVKAAPEVAQRIRERPLATDDEPPTRVGGDEQREDVREQQRVLLLLEPADAEDSQLAPSLEADRPASVLTSSTLWDTLHTTMSMCAAPRLALA